MIAPEIGEAHQARLLEKEEREAAAAASFKMSEDGHGKCHGRFTIDAVHGAMLRKALLALAAPKHRASVDGTAPAPGRPTAHRIGQAFCEYIEGYPADRLPHAGGTNATMVVTIPVETLTGGLKAAAAGHRPAGLPRAVPAGWRARPGSSPPSSAAAPRSSTWAGRRRFHTEPQRIALALEQGGCTAEGCDWPPGLCHVHHDTPWHQGGHTSLRNGRLLCPRHHTRAHDPTYTHTVLPDGKIRFHRRT